MRDNETILRLLTMLRLIPRYPQRIDTATLERKLADEGFHVTRRTIQRDLHRLSRTFPLTSDDHKPTGWSWAAEGAILDLPGMDPSTALTFVLMETFLTPLLPPATLRHIQPYVKRAQRVFEATSANDLCAWPAKVRVIHRGPPLQPPTIDVAIQEAVYRGLLEGRRLRVEYCPKTTQQVERYEVNPLGLVFKEGIAYLVCTLWNYPHLKQLVLHRFRRVEVLETSANVLEGFDLDRYIHEGEFSYPMGAPIRLEVVFNRAAAFHLHETPVSPDQTIIDLDEDRVRVRATVHDSSELRWWLLGFGGQVEVVAPVALRQEMQGTALAMAELYRRGEAQSTRNRKEPV